jgi:signal transduction histidine kinase
MRSNHRPDRSAATDAGAAMRRPTPLDRGLQAIHEICWITMAPVITAVIALTTLAAVPWAASWRLANVRLHTAETLVPARQLVRDMAASLALEEATTDRGARGATPELARRYSAAVARGRMCDSALGALAPRLEADLQRDIGRLRSLTARWHGARNGGDGGVAEAGAVLTNALTTAERLDSTLAVRQAQQSLRIQSLESLEVLLPSVLVPLLAIVLFVIAWTGRRMAALAGEAERSRLALAAASEHKITVLRGLTHDLKNALGAAGGFATLLRDEMAGPLTTLQRDYVARIGRLLEQTRVAVEDALIVARTEAGVLPVRRHPEDLRHLVLEAAADYVAAAERADLTLDVEYAEDLPPVDTDPSLVSKIIGNLLSNAIKYTPAGGGVSLRASYRPHRPGSETGPWVVVEVCDTGPGVPAAYRERIFDEFFRTPAATTAARGEGIGLAMSRRVAQVLGGEITLDSEEGRGAAFALWLPAPPHRVGSPVSSPPVGGRPPGAHGARIPDDDPEITATGRCVRPPPHCHASVAYDRRRTQHVTPRAADLQQDGGLHEKDL